MIKINVEINNKFWREKIKNPQKYFFKKLKIISSVIQLFRKKNISFTILLTNSPNMKKLNKKFRNKNKATDVLSFPFFFKNEFKFKKKDKNIYIGDIAVSYEIINSRSKKSNFSKEFDYVWVHGLLHLIGYDHINNKEYLKMNKIEKKILSKFV